MSGGGPGTDQRAQRDEPVREDDSVKVLAPPTPAAVPETARVVERPASPRPTPPTTTAATAAEPAVGSGDLWARVLRGPGITSVLRTILSNLRVQSLDAASGRVVLVGEAKYAESATARQTLIADALRRELGRPVELVIQGVGGESEAGPVNAPDGHAGEGESASSVETQREDRVDNPAPSPPQGLPSEHPLVREAMELFGARIVDVQHRRPAQS